MIRRFTFTLSFLFALAGAALAQNVVPQVQQNSTRLDAATLACSYSAAVAVNQQETTTCTPSAGQYVYIIGISFSACSDSTGAAVGVTDFTTTNLPGTPTFPVAQVAGAGACTQWTVSFATPLKSVAAGTAVTIVSPSASTHLAYQSTVFGYSSP